MKVMVLVKASAGSEAGQLPSQELMAAMGQFNEQLVQAGIMAAGDGLKPSWEGYRVRFSGADRSVSKGPFPHTEELLAGYWIWNVTSMEEAIEWVKRCPNPMPEDSEIEIRSFYEMEDFAEADPDGAIGRQEDQLRQTMAMQQAAVNTYLFFSGSCEQALDYYQAHLGARVHYLMRFSDSPAPVPEDMLQPGFEHKVMHAEVSVGNVRIMASDGCNDASQFSGFRLALTVPTPADAQRVFNALADGGTIDMPLSEVFWSPLYGQVTDRFGVAWMVMIPGPQG